MYDAGRGTCRSTAQTPRIKGIITLRGFNAYLHHSFVSQNCIRFDSKRTRKHPWEMGLGHCYFQRKGHFENVLMELQRE